MSNDKQQPKPKPLRIKPQVRVRPVKEDDVTRVLGHQIYVHLGTTNGVTSFRQEKAHDFVTAEKIAIEVAELIGGEYKAPTQLGDRK